MSENNSEPRWNTGDIVYIASGEYRYDETGFGETTELEVGEEDLEVVSSDYIGTEWQYNLRNDDGDRVWNVLESDLA